MKKKSKRTAGKPTIRSNKHTYKGINFKSTLEKDAYILLDSYKFKFKYEPITYTILENKTLVTTNVISFSKKKCVSKKDVDKYGVYKRGVRNSKNMQPMRYTPDFIVYHDDFLFVIETKGFANDAYPLRKKVFLHYIDSISEREVYFFELKDKDQVRECCIYINNLITKK